MKRFRITYEWTDDDSWTDPTTYICRVGIYAKDKEDAKQRFMKRMKTAAIKSIIELK